MLCLVIIPQLLRSDAETEALRNDFANRAHYEYLVDEDALIIGPDGVIARLVTGCLDAGLVKETTEYFRTVHGNLSNRGSVVGKDSMMNRERGDDTLGFTKEVPPSIIQKMREENTFSDFLGWFDKSQVGDRFPYCRQTAWSLSHPDVLEAARPFVKEVDRIYREELPDHWKRQQEFMKRVSPDFKFDASVFSTVTVNRNLRTAYHYDKDDFRSGMGNLVVLDGDGSGPLVMPRYRLALLAQPTDVLLMNVHELHGNAIFTGERLTAVLYAREHINECEGESEAAKDRDHKTIFGPPKAFSSHRGSLESSDTEIKQESESVINAEHKYDPNFVSKEEADALLAVAQSLPRDRPLNKLSGFKNHLRRLQMPCYSATPNWRGSENEQTNQWMMGLDEAPTEVKSLAEKLSKLAGKPVNYFSFVGYENEKDHIDWHQHREDKCRDARVFIISLGEVRTFGLRKLCDKCRVCDDCNKKICAGETNPSCQQCKQAHMNRKTCKACKDKSKWLLLQPEHGSLITLPDSYNNTHEHAVLDDKGPKGLRISINTKHISAEDIAAGNGNIPKEHRHGGPTSKTEVVHCMKEKYDVYIGRQNGRARLPESPFANRSGSTDAYRIYFLERLRDEPDFAGKVLKLCGKTLGCWCKGTKRDFSDCHGHIVAEWADKLHAKWEELKPDKVVMRSWLNEAIENELRTKEGTK